jgi:hypothetical protein
MVFETKPLRLSQMFLFVKKQQFDSDNEIINNNNNNNNNNNSSKNGDVDDNDNDNNDNWAVILDEKCGVESLI